MKVMDNLKDTYFKFTANQNKQEISKESACSAAKCTDV